jgi:CRISPR-associated endonuclease Cas1
MYQAVAMFFFRLTFKVLRPITDLQFYTGVYWSAMLRDWIRPYTSMPLADLRLHPIPLQNGVTEYQAGDAVWLDLACSSSSVGIVRSMLEDELKGQNQGRHTPSHQHFVLGESIELTEFRTLHDGALDPDCLYMQQELQNLRACETLDLLFYTPLRMKPAAENKGSNRFMDPLNLSTPSFFPPFCRELGIAAEAAEYPELKDKGFIWVDVHYSKSLGGIMGGMRIQKPDNEKLLKAIVWGQYTGLGKNRCFGFGFYCIRESEGFRSAQMPGHNGTLYQRVATISNLRSALEELKSSSPGPDNIAKEDLISAGKPYLVNAQRQLLQGSLAPGDSLIFRKKTHSGSFRIIKVANLNERHLLLAILRQMEQAVDSLLSPACYSYRRGRDYHQAARAVFSSFKRGFAAGIKGDISAFFDSIPHSAMQLMLKGLFYQDRVVELISSNLLTGTIGIPQGNPLSPMLSNLYLIPFDRAIMQQKWRLVRYADDFCAVSDLEHKENMHRDFIAELLGKLMLKLSEQKSTSFDVQARIDFCGYSIDRVAMNKIKIPKPKQDYYGSGVPAFQEDIVKGKPLYLTFKDSYARLDNSSIQIQNDEGSKSYSLKEISRIVIVGKPRVSAGLIQQAIIRGKPVSFISVTGKALGGFAQSRKLRSVRELYNSVVKDWNAFCISFGRSVVAAKIHNQRMVLRQHRIDEQRLKELELSLQGIHDPDSLRGKEGAASVIYWSHFRQLALPLAFPRRAYHPPEGPVNCLLSLGYSILYHRLAECLLALQINPWEGIFHEARGMHMALASDLIEPFRFLVDRIVLSMIHNKQISAEDFVHNEYSSYERLSSAAMRKYIHRFEFTMRNEVKIGNEVLNWALAMDRSAGKLLQSLRLGIDFMANRIA